MIGVQGHGRLGAIFGLVWVVALTWACVPASAAGVWSSPALIDHQAPFAHHGTVRAVTCASPSLCVAVDDAGDVITSTVPTGGTSEWLPAVVVSSISLTDVSCPSVSFCVAIGGQFVAASSDPSGGPHAWSYGSINTQGALTGISCPSSSLCVAIDNAGEVVTSTSPSGFFADWSVAKIDADPNLVSISCPSSSLCVALDNDGNVLTSDNPTGGANAWTATPAVDGTGPISLTCGSVSLCVLVDGAGRVVTSTDPTGGAGAWSAPSSVDPGFALDHISCISDSFCAATDNDGNVLSSSDPSAGGASWTATQLQMVTPPSSFTGLSCVSGLCVVTDLADDAIVSTDPSGGAGAWVTTPIDGVDELADVSCPIVSLCAAVDRQGHLVSSTNPSGGQGAWSSAVVDGSALAAISCPSAFLCVAVDSSGGVLTSTNPAGGASAWTRAQIAPNGLTSVSCASTSLCVAVDGNGNVATSSEPTGGASAWKLTALNGDARPFAVSCVSGALCAAVDSANVVTTTEPTGGATAWTTTALVSGHFGDALTAISCSSTTLCVLLDDNQRRWTSSNPTGGSGAWTVAPMPRGDYFSLGGLACTLPSFCVALDPLAGAVSTSDSPTTHWGTETELDTNLVLRAVSCASSLFCVAVDNAGYAMVMKGFPPLVPSEALTLSTVGRGTVSGLGGTPCSGRCSKSAPQNTTLTLTAAPLRKARFIGWGGACTGTQPQCSLKMTSPQTVTAAFADNLAPRCKLRSAPRQRSRSRRPARTSTKSKPSSIKLLVTCDARAKVSLRGTVTELKSQRKHRRKLERARFALGPRRATVNTGPGSTLTLVLSGRAMTGLLAHAKASLVLVLSVTGPHGSASGSLMLRHLSVSQHSRGRPLTFNQRIALTV